MIIWMNFCTRHFQIVASQSVKPFRMVQFFFIKCFFHTQIKLNKLEMNDAVDNYHNFIDTIFLIRLRFEEKVLLLYPMTNQRELFFIANDYIPYNDFQSVVL